MQLFQADAVLAADRPPHIRAYLHDLRRRGMDPLQLVFIPFIKKNQRMQIAVSGVKYVGDGEVIFLADFHHFGERLRQTGARYGAIVDEIVGTQAAHGAEGALPAGPDVVAFRLVLGNPDFPHIVLPADSEDAFREPLHTVFQAVELDDQDRRRIGGKAHVIGLFDCLNRQVVHHLEGSGNDPFPDDGGHCIASLFNGVVDAEHRLDRLRLRHNPEDRLGDDAQRSLGSPQDPQEVETGIVQGLPAHRTT